MQIKNWGKALYTITENGGARQFAVKGRERWALDQLIAAGGKGCTPIDNPAPRWSAYVHNLRRKYGLNIETITEPHDGPFAGHHARYVLRCTVKLGGTLGAALGVAQ